MRIAWLSAAAFLAMFAMSFEAAAPARAGMLKCNSHTMVHADYAAMKRAATKTAAAHVLDWANPTPCMNPGRGRVWINGKPEPQADGTRIDIAAICERREGPWKCEVLSKRRYEFSMPVFGREQEFKLDVPLQLHAAEARAFAVLAFERGAGMSVLDACGRRENQPRTAHDDESDRDIRATFASRKQPAEGSIEITEQGMTFTLESYALEFVRASPAEPWSFKCWWEVIVVA